MKKILVVDDEFDLLTTWRLVLQMEGYEVSTASNGVLALESVHANPPDLIFTDWMMPRMDGVEALRRLRAGEAGRPDIWVIAFTADAMSGDDARFLGIGFDAVQTKPIQPLALLTALADSQRSPRSAAAPCAASA